MPGPDVAAPQPRNPARGVVVDVRPNEHIFGVDDQLHRNRYVAIAPSTGQSAQEVGTVNLQAVGGIGDKSVCLVALLRRDAGGDEPSVDRPSPEGPHHGGGEHRNREADHVAEVDRLRQRLGEAPRPVRMGQAAPDEAAEVLRVWTGDRRVGGNPLGGRRPTQDLPHRRRAPIVADHVHPCTRGQRGDHGFEVVRQTIQRVGRHRIRHRGRAGPSIVVADNSVVLGEQGHHGVPDRVRVGPAVHENHGRSAQVALLVNRDPGSAVGIDESRGRHCASPGGSSDARCARRRWMRRRASKSRFRCG